MTPDSSDPSVIDTIAVTVEDVVAAVEMNRTTSREAVLRITPPFSGRMRARLHVDQGEEYSDEPAPLHVSPERLLADNAPPVPRPADTEDELRADPDVEYTVERHRERHAAAVEEWRATLPESIRDEARLETAAGTHTGGCNSFTHQSLLSAETDPFRLDSQFECSRTYSHQYQVVSVTTLGNPPKRSESEE